MSDVTLDVREMPPRERHPRIFSAWEALPVGAILRLVNDHDPKPLYYEFDAERKGEFSWEPVERGPERWVVAIKRVAAASAASGAAAPAERPSWADASSRVVDVRERLRRGEEPIDDIMKAVDAAAPGSVFAVRAIFEPRPLYHMLGARGFEHWTERLAADDWKIHFRRKA